jgi:hypothetical protein
MRCCGGRWIKEGRVGIIHLGWMERLKHPFAISVSFYLLVFGISFDLLKCFSE